MCVSVCVCVQAHPESKLQEAALFVAGNLVWRGEAGAGARQARLADLGVLRALKLLRSRHDAAHLHDRSIPHTIVFHILHTLHLGFHRRSSRV